MHPTVQPAACRSESRFAQPTTDVFARSISAVALRGGTSRTLQLRGYPASTTLARLGAGSASRCLDPVLTAGQYLYAFFERPRAPCPLPSGNRDDPACADPRKASPPPSTFILAAVCRASRTHPAVAVRACTDAAELRKVPGVRAIHMSSTRHNAANRRQSYGYRSVRVSSTWITRHLIYFRKRPHHCAARSVGYFWPVAGVGYRRAGALHSHSMRQRRGRCA